MARKDTHVEKPDITASEIYEGGTLQEIKAADLLNNEVAIRMVMNDLNKKNKEIVEYQDKVSGLQNTISDLKLSPLFQLVTGVFNALAAIVMSIGTNILDSKRGVAIGLIVIASAILLFADLFPLLKKLFK